LTLCERVFKIGVINIKLKIKSPNFEEDKQNKSIFMKKWFIKNRDAIFVGSIAGFIAGILLFIVNQLFYLLNSYQNSFLNFLYKLSKISIPLYAIVVFILLTILISKLYNIIKIKNKKLKIISATYYTELKSIDITDELNDAIENNKLKIILSNNIAGDPHKGAVKKGKIKYIFNGEEDQKEYQEDDLIKLP